MSIITVPVSKEQEEFVSRLISRGYAPNKAEVLRRALRLLAEEEAVAAVVKAEQEAREGKTLRGDIRKLVKKISRPFNA